MFLLLIFALLPIHCQKGRILSGHFIIRVVSQREPNIQVFLAQGKLDFFKICLINLLYDSDSRKERN